MELIFLKTFLLGIVEGLTEFIPVSSTAHLLLAGRALRFDDAALLETLAISIQSGAILAAVWYFWRTIWRDRSLIGKVALAFLPTAAAGLALYPLIKSLFESELAIALALIAGGIGLISVKPSEGKAAVKDISYRQALLIGVAQIASFIPGVSRAGATLIFGSLLRIPRALIVPFSFLLAIPTILGASVVEVSHLPAVPHEWWQLIALGAVVAFATALATMRLFIRVLTDKPLAWFGWYRIALGILALLFVA